MADTQKTQKEMYAYIAELLANDPEVVAFCEKKIAQLDKPSTRKVNPEVQERRNTIKNYLETLGKPVAVKEIGEALGYSSPQITGALRGLVAEGVVETIEPDQKSKPKTYAFVNSAENF